MVSIRKALSMRTQVRCLIRNVNTEYDAILFFATSQYLFAKSFFPWKNKATDKNATDVKSDF